MNGVPKTSTRRVGWIDAARALGSCAIVFLHVLVSTNLAFELSAARRIAYAIAGIVLSRWAVPAFFMISGMLFLDLGREMSRQRVLEHVRRMVLVIVTFGTVFALMQEIWVRMGDGLPINASILPVVVVDVLTMRTWDHMWFVYALAGVYLFVPVLRWVGRRFGTRGHQLLTLVLFVVVLVIPTLRGGFTFQGPISTFLWNVAVGCSCFCVGGCLKDWHLNPAWTAIGIGSVIVMVMVSITGIGAGVGDNGYIFLQGSCFSCLYAVFILLLMRYVVGEGSLEEGGIVHALAVDSFGIYLIHPLFIHLAMMVTSPAMMVPVVYEVLLGAGMIAVSWAAARLLRLVPFFDELL